MPRETDAEFDARMERQYADYVVNGSYEYVSDPNGTIDLGDGMGPYIRRKRRKNNKAVRGLIDIMKNDPEVRELMKRD